MTTIPQLSEVCAAQVRALQALAPTANLAGQGPTEVPPERAERPAHGSPGGVDMAVRPLPTTLWTPASPNVTTVIPLDAIPAVMGVAR